MPYSQSLRLPAEKGWKGWELPPYDIPPQILLLQHSLPPIHWSYRYLSPSFRFCRNREHKSDFPQAGEGPRTFLVS